MPKAERIRHTGHLSSVKLKQSKDTISDVSELLPQKPETEPEIPQPRFAVQITKREKMQERRQSFLQKLGSGLPFISKSHLRRMKRKAREQLAGDTLADLSAALPVLDKGTSSSESRSNSSTTIVQDSAEPSTKSLHQRPGIIGEGKPHPLSNAQRKRVFELERLRHPLVLQNPEFSVNPFQTIQTHARNTLLKHKPS